MADPKLVEALAHTILRFTGFGVERYPDAHATARSFFDTYALVQLPKEPSGWVSPENAALIHNSDAAETVVIDRHPGGNLPVYIFPGDPQEVDDG